MVCSNHMATLHEAGCADVDIAYIKRQHASLTNLGHNHLKRAVMDIYPDPEDNARTGTRAGAAGLEYYLYPQVSSFLEGSVSCVCIYTVTSCSSSPL